MESWLPPGAGERWPRAPAPHREPRVRRPTQLAHARIAAPVCAVDHDQDPGARQGRLAAAVQRLPADRALHAVRRQVPQPRKEGAQCHRRLGADRRVGLGAPVPAMRTDPTPRKRHGPVGVAAPPPPVPASAPGPRTGTASATPPERRGPRPAARPSPGRPTLARRTRRAAAGRRPRRMRACPGCSGRARCRPRAGLARCAARATRPPRARWTCAAASPARTDSQTRAKQDRAVSAAAALHVGR